MTEKKRTPRRACQDVVPVVLDVEGVAKSTPHLEVGLQDRRGQLDEGTRLPDGAVRYQAEVSVRRTPEGGLAYTGPWVHGPTDGRFFYVGLRTREPQSVWYRRFKIFLPSQLPEGIRQLRVRARDRGTTKAELVDDGWIAERGDSAERGD